MKKLASKGLLMSALICGNVLWGGTTVLANEVQEYDLDAVVVTATRTMKQIQEVPSSVSVVTAKDIEERNITSVPEALQTLPGVYKSQAIQGGIQLRGFGSGDILVLVDGLQMNYPFNSTVDWEMIPVENIERIEVVRGAGSSLYGGHAVGGVVNIITKDAKKKGLNANIVLNYGSNNTWKKALYADVKANEKVSFGVGYENRKSDGWGNYYQTKAASKGSGTIVPDNKPPQLSNGKYIVATRGDRKYESETYSANVKYNFDAERSLKYTFANTTSTYYYPSPKSYIYKDGKPVWSGKVDLGNGTYVSPSLGTSLGYDGEKEYNKHTLAYNDDKNKINANFSLLDMKKSGYSSASGTAKEVPWYGAGSDSLYPGKTYVFDFQKAWENIGKHDILIGGDFKQEEFTQYRKYLKNYHDHNSVDTSKGKNGLFQVNTGKAQNIALFVQDEYKFNEPWTMYLGLRYDHYKKYNGSTTSYNLDGSLDANNSSKHGEGSYNELSPKIAFDFKADDNTNYYVSYGHSFNPPPFSQIFRYEQNVHANPDLDPETSDTFEIGMKKKISDKTNIGISMYKVKTDDKIVYTYHYKPGTKVVDYKSYENYGTEKRRGVEFSLEHKLTEELSGYLNYSWQHGKVERTAVANTNLGSVNSTDYGIPKHLLHAGLNYKKDKLGVNLDCQYVSARQAPDDETGEYGSEDPYFIVNMGFNYEIAKNAVLQFTVDNVFDREFYASEPTSGRVYSVGLRYSF